ncbi:MULTISPECIES: hypothetical protein [Microbacterium]|uniref:hypothetical protein n=1 Tax=Microbacterium TaxID=33882 RepID=UPI000D652DB5|nr:MULTISPECIES: hypothetical protein [Microbacterium]
MSHNELLLQTIETSSRIRDDAQASGRTPRRTLRDRLLRWRVAPEPMTPEEHHHRRLLENARREREAEMLRQMAMWVAIRPF